MSGKPGDLYGTSVACFILAMIEPAIVHNSFGLDARGVDRYRLLPLSSKEIVLSKNLAFFIVFGLQTLPLSVAAARLPKLPYKVSLAPLCFCLHNQGQQVPKTFLFLMMT